MRFLRRAVPALLAVAVAVPLAAPAQAGETTPRPPDGVLEIEGRGYGHGRGLSQWGAYGAADAGLGWQEILRFYYPDTVLKDVGNTPIRVWISRDGDDVVEVVPDTGLTVTTGGTATTLPAGAQYDGWRVVRSGAGLVLETQDDGVWRVHPLPLAGDAAFSTAGEFIRLVLPDGNRQHMRGAVRAVPDGTRLRTVAVMPMESYLRGVVPAEMPASWAPDAVRAQSVAARTYAARLRADSRARTYDTCDTTACQVYAGTATYRADGTAVKQHEHARSDAAIAATAGQVLYFTTARGDQQIVFTEFSASNGGWTAAGAASHPYQVAKPDPYDGRIPSSAHSWTTTANVSVLERAYPSIGVLNSVRVDSRNGLGAMGGRVEKLTLVGSRGSVQVTGADARRVLGLKSTWFRFLGPFADVPVGHTFYDEITWLASEGITQGVGNNVFDTRSPVQRQHMAAFLFRMAADAGYVAPARASFSDVPTTHPLYREISWLADNGISVGVGGGRFDTQAPVERDEMAAFLHRLSGETHQAPAASPFPDVPADWGLYAAVTWLAQSGVTAGYADGTFRPNAPVERQHMAAFLYRYSHR